MLKGTEQESEAIENLRKMQQRLAESLREIRNVKMIFKSFIISYYSITNVLANIASNSLQDSLHSNRPPSQIVWAQKVLSLRNCIF